VCRPFPITVIEIVLLRKKLVDLGKLSTEFPSCYSNWTSS